VQSGAADLFSADAPTASAALHGLAVATAPFGLTGIQYSDRDGTIVPALKDPKVRQALNYAIDRKGISEAVYKDLSTPGTTPVQKGFPGFNDKDNSAYGYDLEKAKKLLAEAGYADGFSFDMSVPTANNTNLMAQAVVQSWAKIGVNAKLTTYTDLGQLTTDILAKKYPVSAFNYGALPTYVQSKSFFTGGATQFNPFNSTNAQIKQGLVEAAQGTTDDARGAAYGKAWHTAVIDQAWLTNVYTRFQPTVYNDKKITGVEISTQNPIVDLAWTVAPVTK
jgi:peptide/nickel transport system substrate-binding protein